MQRKTYKMQCFQSIWDDLSSVNFAIWQHGHQRLIILNVALFVAVIKLHLDLYLRITMGMAGQRFFVVPHHRQRVNDLIR